MKRFFDETSYVDDDNDGISMSLIGLSDHRNKKGDKPAPTLNKSNQCHCQKSYPAQTSSTSK